MADARPAAPGLSQVRPEPCREAYRIGTQCGGPDDPVMCFYGPCRSTVPEVKTGTLVTIFHPRSDPSVCGLEIDGLEFMPEKFDTQETYEGVVATCPYNDCMWPGIPVTR